MKNFKHIDIDNLDTIINKAYAVIEQGKLPNHTHLYYLDDYTCQHDRFKDIPELAEEMKKLGWYEYWLGTAIVVNYQDLPIHQDTGDFEYSLNLPIKNTKGTYTAFYDVSAAATMKVVPNTSVTYMSFDPEISTLIEQVELIQPTLLNVKTPHNVVLKTTTLPRITIALRLGNNFKIEGIK